MNCLDEYFVILFFILLNVETKTHFQIDRIVSEKLYYMHQINLIASIDNRHERLQLYIFDEFDIRKWKCIKVELDSEIKRNLKGKIEKEMKVDCCLFCCYG